MILYNCSFIKKLYKILKNYEPSFRFLGLHKNHRPLCPGSVAFTHTTSLFEAMRTSMSFTSNTHRNHSSTLKRQVLRKKIGRRGGRSRNDI